MAASDAGSPSGASGGGGAGDRVANDKADGETKGDDLQQAAGAAGGGSDADVGEAVRAPRAGARACFKLFFQGSACARWTGPVWAQEPLGAQPEEWATVHLACGVALRRGNPAARPPDDAMQQQRSWQRQRVPAPRSRAFETGARRRARAHCRDDAAPFVREADR